MAALRPPPGQPARPSKNGRNFVQTMGSTSWYARRSRLPNDDSRWLASPDDDIALCIVVTPRGLQAGSLGRAMPLSTTGLNTRVFVDHVATTAFRENRSFGNVLAHAMAHEIGHVLLRSAGHEGHSIMASPWTTREYDQMTVLRTMTFLANIRHLCGILLPGETVMRFSISSVESILFFTGNMPSIRLHFAA